jgi:hypothetical protein
MKRGVSQPLQDHVIESAIFFDEPRDDPLEEPGVHHPLGDPVDLGVFLEMRQAHTTGQIAQVRRFDL